MRFWFMAAKATRTKGPLVIVRACGGLLAYCGERRSNSGLPSPRGPHLAGITPVSYTHRDVDKRQLQACKETAELEAKARCIGRSGIPLSRSVGLRPRHCSAMSQVALSPLDSAESSRRPLSAYPINLQHRRFRFVRGPTKYLSGIWVALRNAELFSSDSVQAAVCTCLLYTSRCV